MRAVGLPLVVGGVVTVAIAAVIACTETADPRAGTRKEASSGGPASSSGGTSSSGGIDAAPPEAPIACGTAPSSTAPFTKQALLTATSDCAAWHACNFVNAATTLRASVRGQGDPRAAWKTAMNEWSKLELFQFGPLGSKVADPYHGRGLRTFVHPWPQTSRCEVEKQVASKEFQTQGIGTVLPSGRGLDALEYLLFYAGTDTACLPGSPTGQAFASFAPADLAKAKNDYAATVADNVLALALEVRAVWLPEGENFKTKLLAGDGYGNEQEALNVIGWALFYAEEEIKDVKLASRAGVVQTPPNPETPYALVELENVRANMQAFRSLFSGCGADGAGLGFDDWLTASGQGPLANEVTTALGRVLAAVDAFPAFEKADATQFRALYDTLRELTNLLKSRLFGSGSPLNLKLPANAASDTD